MFGRSTGRTSIWSRLATALGSAVLLASMVGTFAPVALADPVSPITVTKTADKNPVASGQQLTYTIDVKNTGGAKVTNVVLTDQVNGVGVIQSPPALPQLIITSTQGSCTQGGPNGNLVTCNIGTVPGLGTFRVTIRGQVTAGNGTTLNNTASVTGTKSAQNFTTTGSVSVLVSGGTGTPLADLTINKTGPTSIGPTAPMSYTLTVNNIGTANATNVRVVDTLPTGVNFVSTASSSLFTCTPAVATASPVTVICVGGAVNFGQNATITINATSPASGSLTNTAVVDPNNTIPESNELNNTSASVYTTVGGPPPAPLLSIFKTDGNPDIGVAWDNGAGPDPVNPGVLLTYVIQVTNNATGTNSRADDVVVVDGTQGLEAASIVASQVIVNGTVGTTGGCVVNAPQVRCSIRSLNSGGTLTITIKGTVQQSAGSTIFNTATVTGNIKNTGVTNTDSEETTVRPAVDLTITKADSPDPVCARSWPTTALGQHLPSTAFGVVPPAAGSPTALLAPPVCLGGLTYHFVVGNSGIASASGVTVRDDLPVGLIFDSYDTNGDFVCSVADDEIDGSTIVTCTGSIPAESIRDIWFRLVAPPGVGSITNTVYVDPNNAIFEPDETNNTATQTTAVATGVDLVVWKSDSVNVNPPGDDNEGAPTLIPGTSTNLADGYDPIATSGTQTVTIYVDNVGTQDVTGIRLRDTLPAGTRFLSVMEVPGGSDLDPGLGTLHGFTCSHNGATTGGVVECVGGNLLGTESEFYEEAGAPPPPPPGDHFATIKIRFFARPEVGTMHNEVRVDPLNEIAEVNELNNLATDETLVTVGNSDKGAYHQLTVDKTQIDPAPTATPPDPGFTVATNGTLIYNLHVSNLGTDPVSNIVLQDQLPAGTRFIEAKDTDTGTDAFFCLHDGSALGGVITCTGGDLDGSINTIPVGGISRDVTVKVFAPNTPGTYNNLAVVDPANLVPEGNEFDNDDQLQTLVAPCVGQADCTGTNAFYELTIGKSQVSPAPPIVVATNGVITYDLLITNLGSDPVSGIVVKDTLPEGSRFIDARDTGAVLDPSAFSCGAPDATRTLTCSGGTLDGTLDTLGAGVAQARTIRIRIFAPNTPTNSLVNYPNLSSVDPANGIPEGNEFNNTSNIQTPVAPCDPAGVPDDCTDANAFYELTIAKSQDRPTIARNGLETYTLKIENFGSDPVSNIVVEDALPAGSRFIDAKDTAPPSDPAAFTCGSPNASGVLTCTGGDLSGTVNPLTGIPAFRSIVVRVFMPDTPSSLTDLLDGYPNQATVDPHNAIPEGNEFNNTTSIKTRVENGGPDPYIDLKLEKAQDFPDPATVPTVDTGGQIRYTLTISNLGEADAFNVQVRDVLPQFVTFHNGRDRNDTVGQFTCGETSPGIIDCTGGTIPAGGSRLIDINVDVVDKIDDFASSLSAVSVLITNQASVDPFNAIGEGNESNNDDFVDTTIKPPVNLKLEKQGSDTATQNDTTTYTIKVTNEKTTTDGATAFGVKIVDPLPVGLIPLSITAEPGNFTCQVEENPVNFVTCVGDLEAGKDVTITIKAFVTQDGGTLDNEACVDPADTIAETNELDNCKHAIGQVIPPKPDLLINKSADKGSVTQGEELTYTLTVSNIGTGDSSSQIDVTDNVPSDVTVNDVSPDAGWDCSATSGNSVSCFRSDLAKGESSHIVIRTTVNSGVTSPIKNKADVSGGGETNTANDHAEVLTSVGGAAIDLILSSLTDTPDPVNARPHALTYVAVAINAGTAGADNAIVRLEFPDTGVTVVGVAASNGFVCVKNLVVDVSGLTYDCKGDFGASGTLTDNTTVTADVTVNNGAPAVLKATAIVDPADAIGESDETNNKQEATTTVSGTVCTTPPCIDLVVSDIFDTPDPVANGGSTTYTVSVVNVGDTATNPTTIWDMHFLFSGTGSVTVTPPAGGVTCAMFGGDPQHIHCTGVAGADAMDLAPGAGITFIVTVTGMATGTASLEVIADIFDEIPEFTNSNNSVTETTTINP